MPEYDEKDLLILDLIDFIDDHIGGDPLRKRLKDTVKMTNEQLDYYGIYDEEE